ncbi:Glutathione S-transferase [Phytophthora cinnamomi]|uniref:Glutathione S-transferase n=1 Tax=Phytophthora cinnamomi TaxID=4785 RepID=UPI002A25FCC6|nr:Glutathione S-transferase [Phytophthora cinnamomi]KAJ8556646.1 hypothetical protein ON010_g9320 [Phytophthora cinnamomi]
MAAPPPYASFVQPNADAEFPAEKDRYHLYVSYACPFASRALSARYLKGLEGVVGLTVAHPIHQKTKPDDDSDTHRGWYFVDPSTTPTVTGVNGREYSTEGCIPDTVNHVKFARDLFEMVDPTPRKFSVPILWDKKKKTIVSEGSADILRMFNSAFNQIVPSEVDILPKELESEVDAANNGIVMEISGPYFKAAFAHDAEGSQVELTKVFAGVAKLDEMLATKRYLVGKGITEADIRLFHLLIRVDVAQAEGSEYTLTKYPNVVGYLRDLYQTPAMKKTVNWEHLRIGWVNHKPDAPHLTGPYVDYDASHQRSSL